MASGARGEHVGQFAAVPLREMAVSLDDHLLIRMTLDSDVLVFRKQANLVRGARSQLTQIEWRGLFERLSGVQPAQREESFNDSFSAETSEPLITLIE